MIGVTSEWIETEEYISDIKNLVFYLYIGKLNCKWYQFKKKSHYNNMLDKVWFDIIRVYNFENSLNINIKPNAKAKPKKGNTSKPI